MGVQLLVTLIECQWRKELSTRKAELDERKREWVIFLQACGDAADADLTAIEAGRYPVILADSGIFAPPRCYLPLRNEAGVYSGRSTSRGCSHRLFNPVLSIVLGPIPQRHSDLGTHSVIGCRCCLLSEG